MGNRIWSTCHPSPKYTVRMPKYTEVHMKFNLKYALCVWSIYHLTDQRKRTLLDAAYLWILSSTQIIEVTSLLHCCYQLYRTVSRKDLCSWRESFPSADDYCPVSFKIRSFERIFLPLSIYWDVSLLWREDTIKTKKGSTGNSDVIGFKLDVEVLHFNLYSLENVGRHSN